MSMFTSNFNTSPESGWIGGLAVRGNYYNNWSAIFGMQFTESNFSVATTNFVAQQEQVKYTLSGVQIRFLLSYNVIKKSCFCRFWSCFTSQWKFKNAR